MLKDANKELKYSSSNQTPGSSKNGCKYDKKNSNIYSIESVADSSNYTGFY